MRDHDDHAVQPGDFLETAAARVEVVNGVPAMCLRWSGLADSADPPLQYDRQQQRRKSTPLLDN